MSEPDVDVLVVGGGAAGLSAALAAARTRRVAVVVKGPLGDGATPWAQGGIAAAIGPGDSPRQHLDDTLVAGAGLSRPEVVRELVGDGPTTIDRLLALGARFDTSPSGDWALGREGGHRRHRVVHAGGDRTGAEVSRALVTAVRERGIEVLEHTLVSDLLLDDRGHVAGVVTLDRQGRRGVVTSCAVVLATGGLGQLYSSTSNPRGATGDGLALALRAGAVVGDAEFVQFHPTLLWTPGEAGQRPLVTEALRGAGAVLVDRAGRRLMEGVHPLGDLAPRDVVAARLHEHLQTEGVDHAFLDATPVGPALATDFPGVSAACAAAGVDVEHEPVPVAPGAHYHCGGVRASTSGVTDVPGLLAVGEVAWTGMQGANRLASNSLLEALSTGARAGELLAERLPQATGAATPSPAGPSMPSSEVPRLRRLVSTGAGVSRDGTTLAHLVDELDDLAARGGSARRTTEDVEASHLLLAASVVARGASMRLESRGSHRRTDHPHPKPHWQRSLVSRLRAGRVETGPEIEEISA